MLTEQKHYCTGCSACCNICPQNAISMQGDKYGFYKPVIDTEKCINCGLCEKICPLNNPQCENFGEPKTYAFMHNDEVRMKSSSGGAFWAFASIVTEQNGNVYGCVWDENMKAVHKKATTYKEIEKMHGSKYVQSKIGDTFKMVKEDLENGKPVLFTGTPCQIAGLYGFLQKKYDNLLTIDLICHGTPSPLVFEKYKDNLLKIRPSEEIVDINFRSKIKGWSIQYLSHYTTTTTTTTSTTTTTRDPWIYLMNHSINASCSECQFNKLPRTADISIGDFWGIDDYDAGLNDNKGTSLILVNNEKGLNFISKIDKNCKLVEVPLSAAIAKNHNIYESTVADMKREAFLNDLCIKNKSFNYCAKKYLRTPLYILIYRLLPKFIKNFIKYTILKKEKC